ncbi:hypothetical protein SMI01S_24970 [Sphingobacterium mizutaii NBRC 14946 = DSM 11724]|uniref:6-phosphogluconate dehydrogenase n=2 Tax=Sphingobacterium mizutaii TaxID=1010 RepID=A0AAJ4XA45_9SPHI|nr:hypothetical protein [Sphingobacterium mizutaii]GEM68891.1 hypothetical protein SMI01S_24970 [Sphingobacterium mizutaii NBRC 14946 = DSM 11724]SDK89260.1 hypothetical protein SAMN05192578_101179 [Sphingobacterium mizutaii]SNV46849.1 Uncharacterised protein [Sphingobacterium mizutaii]
METSNQQPSTKGSKFKKFISWFLLILFLAFAGFVYFKYYFVFGEGVKSGVLNYAVKKGNLFKTYEGKLIQEGIRSQKTGTGLSSNEFEFSIENDSVFHILELNSGKAFDLHYKEYHGVLPWRGNTRYVVDKIIQMRDAKTTTF